VEPGGTIVLGAYLQGEGLTLKQSFKTQKTAKNVNEMLLTFDEAKRTRQELKEAGLL